jgi:hypothetical protein
MLGKLLKYEFMSTARIFLPLYAALVGVSAILKLFLTIETKIRIMILPQFLLGLLYVALIIGVFVVVYVLSCMRFYKNLLGDEGYLMHTLPVKPYKHILAKLITTAVWMVASLCVAVLSVIILALRKGLFSDIFGYIDYILTNSGILAYKSAFIVTSVAFIILMIVSSFTGFLMLYASMSVGQLLRGHKIVGAIAAYFGFCTLTQVISLIVLLIMSKTGIWFALEQTDVAIINNGGWNPFSIFALIFICVYLLLAVAYYIITNFILRRKLNLE